jgi:hypothetical protein
MDAIRGYEHDHLGTVGATIGFAGDVAASQAEIPEIVRTQLWSLLLVLAGLGILYTLTRRRAPELAPASLPKGGDQVL